MCYNQLQHNSRNTHNKLYVYILTQSNTKIEVKTRVIIVQLNSNYIQEMVWAMVGC